MKFHPATGEWRHLSPILDHPFHADLNCDQWPNPTTSSTVKFAVVGDFDGDGQDEVAVALDRGGSESNDFWVMRFDRATGTWKHLSPIDGHSFGADLNCDGGRTKLGVKFALAGRFA
jgi:hypothetical protein